MQWFFRYVYLKDIYKTLKEIGQNEFLSELTILLNLEISRLHLSVNSDTLHTEIDI